MPLGEDSRSKFTDDPRTWTEKQHVQHKRSSHFLVHAPHVHYVHARLKQGGLSQMVQLLYQGCFSKGLVKLELFVRWVLHA